MRVIDTAKALCVGISVGLVAVVFAVGLYTSAAFVINQIGRSWGCI